MLEQLHDQANQYMYTQVDGIGALALQEHARRDMSERQQEGVIM